MPREFRNPLYWAAKSLGRTYWEVRLGDGRTVSEAFTDWDHLLLMKADRREIRLYTPKGITPWLSSVYPDRVFQLKPALANTAGERITLGHLIGVITHDNGQCLCYAWDAGSQTVRGPFYDNVNNLRYENLGPLCLANVGARL